MLLQDAVAAFTAYVAVFTELVVFVSTWLICPPVPLAVPLIPDPVIVHDNVVPGILFGLLKSIVASSSLQIV